MLLRISTLIICVSTAMAAVSSQVSLQAPSSTEKYKMALHRPRSPQSCQTWKSLSKQSDFSLNELAQLRYAQNCMAKVSWPNLIAKIKNPVLLPFFHKAHFDSEIKKRHFGNAYRIYQAHQSSIHLVKTDFDQMASKALKTALTRKEKKELRAALHKKSPRFLPRPNKKDFLKVALDFRRSRQFKKALYYYKKVINDPKQSDSNRWKAFRGARKTYKIERWSQMEKYIKASKQWSHFLDNRFKRSKALTKMHHDANISYIRTLWTEKGQTQAKPILLKLEKQIRGRYSLQMVYWLKGRMAEEKKNYQAATKWLKKASTEKPLSLRDRDRVLWSLAWNQRRIGDYQASQKSLDLLKKSSELTFFSKTKYLYWQAENKKSMGSSQAEQAFARLADLDPYGYYGALSIRKLNIPFPTPPEQVNNTDEEQFLTKKDQFFLKQLLAVQEYEISEKFVLEKISIDRNWSTNTWISYLKLLQKAGAYKDFFRRYHSLPPKMQLAITEEHPHLLFPQPHRNEVFDSAKISKVSPALIYSIMKQESAFDARARSHADAFGLLQLIPPVAQKAAARMPTVPYTTPEDLYKPNVIIPLGADSLQHLFKKFDSNFILSVASYNASEKAVRGWVKSRFFGDPVTFIEDIPYEETKGYVKLVMRNYITYNRFTHKSSNGPFYFPEVCLQGLDKAKRNL